MKYNLEFGELKTWIYYNLFDEKGHLNRRKCYNDGKWIKDNYKNVYEDIIKLTSFLGDWYKKVRLSQRVWHIWNNIFHTVKCESCGKPVKFKNFSNGYKIYCNIECYKNNPENAVRKNKTSKLKKYGDPNFNNVKQMKQTKKERYGDENYNNFQKIRATNKERYGKETFVETNILRDSIKNHEYCLPSGKLVYLQGYEPCVLDLLLEDYHEDEIYFKSKKLPKFNYLISDRWHKYFPDFYIPKENLIIEVKSTWTYKIDFEVNKIKRKSVLEKGYKFKFIVISYVSNSKIIIENVRSVKSEIENSKCE